MIPTQVGMSIHKIGSPQQEGIQCWRDHDGSRIQQLLGILCYCWKIWPIQGWHASRYHHITKHHWGWFWWWAPSAQLPDLDNEHNKQFFPMDDAPQTNQMIGPWTTMFQSDRAIQYTLYNPMRKNILLNQHQLHSYSHTIDWVTSQCTKCNKWAD